MDNFPFISVIIPSKNEERYISGLLDSIIDSDYPKERLEILVIDGLSDDNTRNIVKEYSKKNQLIKLIDNDRKFTQFALNIGIKHSKGDIISIIGAHSKIEKDFFDKGVKYLKEFNVECVGGVRLIPEGKIGYISLAIKLALSSIFGAGNAKFELNPKKVQFSDTAFRPFYKREVFEKIGLFNEKLKRSQDMEFNIRLKKSGGKILLAPDIVSYYYPKDNFNDFFIHNFIDGIWAVYPFKFSKTPLKLRHYVPLFFVLSIIISLAFSFYILWFKYLLVAIITAYIITNLLFSFTISFKKGIKYLFILPLVFLNRHLGYGLGSLVGLVKLFF